MLDRLSATSYAASVSQQSLSVGALLMETVDLTLAQVLGMASVPVTATRVPPANSIIVPIFWTFEINQTLALGANTNVLLKYLGDATTLSQTTPGFTNAAFNRLSFVFPGVSAGSVTAAQSAYMGKPLVLVGSLDNTLGAAANKYRVAIASVLVRGQ